MGSKSNTKVRVFTQTNLGTRVLFAVSPNTTAGEFKRKLERTHINAFPKLGKVASITVMVKQKSNLYCLPDFLPIKYACLDHEQVCHLHVDACPLKKLQNFDLPESRKPISTARHLLFDDHINFNTKKRKIIHKKPKLRGIWLLKAIMQGFMAATYATRKRKKKKRRHIMKKTLKRENMNEQNDQKEVFHTAKQMNSNDTSETPCESLSEVVSVSGLIDRYFSTLVELDQTESSFSTEVSTRAAHNQLKELEGTPMASKRRSLCESNQNMLPEDSRFFGSRLKYNRSEVGERLVVASNDIQRQQSKQRSPTSDLLKGKTFLKTHHDSISANLVFEIGDQN